MLAIKNIALWPFGIILMNTSQYFRRERRLAFNLVDLSINYV